MGYETHNTVLNLGSIGIFSMLYFLKIGLLLLPLKLLRKFKLADALYSKLFTIMIFSEILELNLGGYLEIMIAANLSYQDTSSENYLGRNLQESTMTSGQVASNILGGYSMILTALMPILCLWVAFTSKEDLKSIEFQERYGVFFH